MLQHLNRRTAKSTERTAIVSDTPDVPTTEGKPVAASEDLPVPKDQSQPISVNDAKGSSVEKPLITVTTDVLEVLIDPVGGTVISAKLLNYLIKLEEPDKKVFLLEPRGEGMFIAQSGLLSPQDAPNHTSQYEAERLDYVLAEAGGELRVPLRWISEDGH